MEQLRGRVLVIGGARSGKSAYAESLLSPHRAVTYVATAPARPDDSDWLARIAAHKLRRPVTWATVETADLAAVLADAAPGDPPLLVESVTAWLTSVMDEAGSWGGDVAAEQKLASAVESLRSAWAGTKDLSSPSPTRWVRAWCPRQHRDGCSATSWGRSTSGSPPMRTPSGS